MDITIDSRLTLNNNAYVTDTFINKYREQVLAYYTVRLDSKIAHLHISELFYNLYGDLPFRDVSQLYTKYAEVLVSSIGKAILVVGLGNDGSDDLGIIYDLVRESLIAEIDANSLSTYFKYDETELLTHIVSEIVLVFKESLKNMLGIRDFNLEINDMFSLMEHEYISSSYVIYKLHSTNALTLIHLK